MILQTLELFGGIGAPNKAMQRLGEKYGFETKNIDYVEIDEKAVRTYNALYPFKYRPQSVVGYNLKPDILVHGSPCQDFSRAGKRLGGNDEDKTRSSLLFETIRIIEQMGDWKPKVVIWENVKGVLDKDMRHSFMEYLDTMKDFGYFTSYEVLDARDFGIPQARERVFAVSTINGYLDFSKLKKKKMKNVKHFIEKEVDEMYVVTAPSMLRNIEGSSTFIDPSETKFKGRIKVIEDSVATISTKQDRNPNAGVVQLGKDKYRYLTEKECWRLNGFDDEDYYRALEEHQCKKGKKNATLYHQAGNTIVVDVIEAIIEGCLLQGLVEGFEFEDTTVQQTMLDGEQVRLF